MSIGAKGHEVRKPALDLSDVVRQQCTLITGALQWTVAGFARPRRAVKPNACVCRKPRPFDLMKESRNVGHDGRAALLPFEAVGFAV
jgi:hypothetical protein